MLYAGDTADGVRRRQAEKFGISQRLIEIQKRLAVIKDAGMKKGAGDIRSCNFKIVKRRQTPSQRFMKKAMVAKMVIDIVYAHVEDHA